jgi:hypothetical protein
MLLDSYLSGSGHIVPGLAMTFPDRRHAQLGGVMGPIPRGNARFVRPRERCIVHESICISLRTLSEKTDDGDQDARFEANARPKLSASATCYPDPKSGNSYPNSTDTRHAVSDVGGSNRQSWPGNRLLTRRLVFHVGRSHSGRYPSRVRSGRKLRKA